MDKSRAIRVHAPARFAAFTNATSAEDQLRSLEGLTCKFENLEEKLFAFNLFVLGLNHSKRKQWIQTTNALIPNFADISDCFHPGLSLDHLAACVDGPDNSVFVQQFKRVLAQDAKIYFASLVERMVDSTGDAQNEPELLQIARLLQTVAQVGHVTEFSENYKLALHVILANHHQDSIRDLTSQVGYLLCLHFPEERFDHTEYKPMARMSVFRGIVSTSDDSVEDVSTCVKFYSQFTDSGSAMDLHYAVQSLHLLLTRVFITGPKKRSCVPTPLATENSKAKLSINDGIAIVELCLLRWEHTWHMVASNCRALFKLVCQVATGDLLDAIRARASRLESGSKKRFNCLFGLIPFLPQVATSGLVSEILASIRTTSPSIASACQLLQTLIESPATEIDLVMQRMVSHLHADTESVTDVEQLFSTVVKASKRIAYNHQVRPVSPLTILVTQMMLEPTGKSELLLLRLLQLSCTSNSRLVSADRRGIKLDKTRIFTFENMQTFILSADASVVTCAVVIVARLLHLLRNKVVEWYPLLPLFVTGGGVVVVGCCNDDRSVVLQELKRFFDKNIHGGSQADFFKLLWQEATRWGSLLEESQLPMEVVCSVAHSRITELIGEDNKAGFIKSLFEVALTSRWRKVREAARTLFYPKSAPVTAMLHIEFINSVVDKVLCDKEACNDELAGSVFDALFMAGGEQSVSKIVQSMILTATIESPNIMALTCVANADPSAVRATCGNSPDQLLPYLSAIMVYHSQFVGENSTEAILALAGGLFTPAQSRFISENIFHGKVDCRGHPILGSDEESTALAIRSWGSSKAAALALKAIVESVTVDGSILSGIAQILALLLLSVKHPAEIGALESVFTAVVSRLSLQVVEEELIGPICACITNQTSERSRYSLPVALRRSQGLGPLVSSIVKCQASLAIIGSVCERLLSVINSSQSEDDQTLHSLNILRCLVRDSQVPEILIEPHIGDILIASIDVLLRLSADFWRVRSSATQLFVQASRRLIGTDNEEDWVIAGGRVGSKKSVSAVEFFFNRTRAASRLLEELVHVIQKNDNEYVLVPVLSVLQSLSALGDLASSPHGIRLLAQIQESLTSDSSHVRRLAAKMIVRKAIESREKLPTELEIGESDFANVIHGKLLLANYLLQVSQLEKSSIDSLISSCKRLWDRPQLPPLISHALIWLQVRLCSIPEERNGRLARFIDTVEDIEVARSETLAKLVISLFPGVVDPHHPFYRELLVGAITGWPSTVSTIQVESCLSTWFEAGYNFGVTACITWLTNSGSLRDETVSRISDWIKGSVNALDENLHEDIKSTLARSALVRSMFPDLHLLLLFDESAAVRLAASVNGGNSLTSYRSIIEKCSSEALLGLLTEPLRPVPESTKLFAEEQVVDFCLRKYPREMASVELRKREFQFPPSIVDQARTLATIHEDHTSFSRVHASRLILE